MKKTFTTLFLLLISIISFAGTFDLGIKGSYNTTSLSTDLNSIKADAKMGYNIGAFGRFGGKTFYIQPEFLYVVKNGDFSTGAITDALKMKYIQVPVLLGLNVLDLKVLSLHAFTGPAISFSSGYKSDQNLKYNLSSSTLDYQLGGGIDVLMFTFDVRYEWSLSKKFDASNALGNFTDKGKTFTVSVGFKFM